MALSSFVRGSLGAACALLALSTVACGPAGRSGRTPRTTSASMQALGAPSPAAAPSLDELRTREAATPLKDFRVRAADGVFELHVKASAAPTVKNKRHPNGTAYSIVSVPIGGETDAFCHANATGFDLAHWVGTFLGEVGATLTELPRVEVEVVDGHPVLLVHTEAVIDDNGVKKRHIAKFAAVQFDRGSVACVHDGVGYESTFRDLARHMVATTKTPGAERPTFRTVEIVRDGDHVFGFEESRVYLGTKPGQWRETKVSSAVMAHGESWATADGGWAGVVDAKGVVSERSMRRVGPKVVFDMSLERKSPGVFAYEGKVGEAAKKGTFTTREPLVTMLSRRKALAAFVRDGKRSEAAVLHFDENVPEAAVREVFTHEGQDQVGIEDRGRKSHCIADARGLCTKSWGADETIRLERVYVAGSL
jgi:hypothetical protein